MSDWLAILAAASAVLGVAAAPASGYRRFALWLAGSVVLSVWLAAALEAALPADQRALYRPLLVTMTGSAAAWVLGRRFAADDLGLMPYVVVLASGSGAVVLTHAASPVPLIGSSLVAGASGAAFFAGSAVRHASAFHRQLLSVCVLLLALSALTTLA